VDARIKPIASNGPSIRIRHGRWRRIWLYLVLGLSCESWVFRWSPISLATRVFGVSAPFVTGVSRRDWNGRGSIHNSRFSVGLRRRRSQACRVIALRRLVVLLSVVLAPFVPVVSAVPLAEAAASRRWVVGQVDSSPASQTTEQNPRARAQAPLPAPVTVAVPFRAPTTRYSAGHRGVDLVAETGAEIYSPADGVITFAGDVAGRGVVVIRHGDLRSTLEPVIPAGAAGDAVGAGAVVGFVEAGHQRCLPATCLHWGVRVNDEYVDPMLLLVAKPRIRLLPWDP
jgi:Peptidase family M23